MEFFFIRDFETEMRRQLVEDMAANLRLGEPFHSVKGCIKLKEPRKWVGDCPVVQVDFCMLKEWDTCVQMILWMGRKPDEDDFFSAIWKLDDSSWEQFYFDALKLNLERKEADDV